MNRSDLEDHVIWEKVVDRNVCNLRNRRKPIWLLCSVPLNRLIPGADSERDLIYAKVCPVGTLRLSKLNEM